MRVLTVVGVEGFVVGRMMVRVVGRVIETDGGVGARGRRQGGGGRGGRKWKQGQGLGDGDRVMVVGSRAGDLGHEQRRFGDGSFATDGDG